MGQEIERKFLVSGDSWRSLGQPVLYRQGYLSTDLERIVRVRLKGSHGFLTIKGTAQGASRPEFEYEIPETDAQEMLDGLCRRPLIEKRRTRIPVGDLVWEVDEFLGENQGLIMAEMELPSVDRALELPSWIGIEVTGDPRYFNSNLALCPFTRWPART